MVMIGGIEYLLTIDDKGTPAIKKFEGQVKTSMQGVAASSKSAASQMLSGWGGVKTMMSTGWGSIKAQIMGVVGGLVSLYGAYRGLKAVVSFLNESIKASQEQERATTKLSQSLAAQGLEVEKNVADFQSFATQLMQTKGVADEVTMDMMGMFAMFTKNTESIKQATSAAIDLAVVLNKDVSVTSMMMAKALAGNVTMFGRLGIKMDEDKAKAEGFSYVMEKLARFLGQADVQMKTYEGSIRLLTLAWGELKESVGTAITQNTTLRALIFTLTDAIWDWKDSIDGGQTAIDALITNGIYKLIDSLQILVKAYGIQMMWWGSMKVMLYSLGSAFAVVAEGILSMAQSLAEASIVFSGAADTLEPLRQSMEDASVEMDAGLNQSLQEAKEGFDLLKNGSTTLSDIKAKVVEADAALKKMGRSAAFIPRSLSDTLDEEGGTKEKKKKKEEWKVPTEPGAFWGEFASLQTQYTSPKSTWDEQQEAFKKLQAMYAQVDAMAASTAQKVRASWSAMAAGMQDSVMRSNTYLQEMASLGDSVATQLQDAFAGTFFNIMKGKFKSLGDLWKQAMKSILDAFLQTLAQMLARAMISKIFGSLLGGGGFLGGLFGAAQGGILPGHFSEIKKFAYGGVATGPTLGMVGEGGSPEAIVPLPDGRSIPVSMQGKKEEPVHVHIYNQLDSVSVMTRAVEKAPHIIVNPIVNDYGNRGPIHKVISRGGK